MKILTHIETGEEITVHDIDARELMKSGEYDSMGEAPGFKATKEAAADVSKLHITVDTSAIKKELDEVLAGMESLRQELASKDARIAELEAALAGKPVDLDSMKAGELIAYANKRKLDIGNIVAQAGQPKVLAAVKAAEAALAAE